MNNAKLDEYLIHFLMIFTSKTSSIFGLSLFVYLLAGCDTNVLNDQQNTPAEKSAIVSVACSDEIPEKDEKAMVTPHPYGGWYCPDNLKGFPPMDIQDLDKIEVIEGRLPTQEEAQSGRSLIYIDPEKHPNAKALDLALPKVATYYNEFTEKEELVIVIQAIVVEQDSIVGFRYANGGNGSARWNEIEFLDDLAVKSLGDRPFVSRNLEINATPEKVWRMLTSLEFERELMTSLGSDAFLPKAWQRHAKVAYPYTSDSKENVGEVTAAWEGVYAQMDYTIDGENYVQKFFIEENPDRKSSILHLVSGPYLEDFKEHDRNWANYHELLRTLSERRQKGDPSLLEEIIKN